MLLLVSSFLAGVALVIVVELFFVYRWFSSLPTSEPKLIPEYKPVTNPKDIADYCSIEGATTSESCHFLNLIFQFLWKEWRDSPKTRNFFMRKMNLEFQELMLNKAAGKFMEQITVSDYYLGDSLPTIKKATVMKIDSRNPTQVPREIDIALEIDYSGGFVISLDVDLIFGKAAHLTVKLNSLVGRLRLQFTRNPCTHWSFSFYEDPVMDIQVESNFQGKNLPKLTSLIHNQIRRSIKKKHTFPHYKVRYKPFFIQEKPQDGKKEVFVHNSLVTVGKIEIEIVECTRLMQLPKGSYIYCTLSLSPFPWKEDMSLRRSLWPVHEVLITRTTSGSIGISFNVEYHTIEGEKREVIRIKHVNPTLASKVDIHHGDILLSINNVDITSIKQAVRLVNNAGNKFTFKLQRPPKLANVPLTSKQQIPTPIVATTSSNEHETNPEDIKSPRNEMQESFDYNSILLPDEDSETEQFVNIILNEIEKEFLDDEEKQDIIKQYRRESSLDLQDASSLTQSSTPDKIGSGLRSPEPILSNVELPESQVDGAVGGEEITDSGIFSGKLERKDTTKKKTNRRSFSFSFGKKKTEPINTMNSQSEPVLTSNSLESSRNSSSSSLKSLIEKSPLLKRKRRVTIQDNKPEQLGVSSTNDSNKPVGGSRDILQSGVSHADAEWDNISQHLVEAVVDNVIDEDDEPCEQKTTLANAHQEPVWNETFSFDVEKEHKFLNICVKGKNGVSYEKDILLGYVSIPLMELAIECLSTTSRKSIQTFYLTSQSNQQPVNRTHLRTVMPGTNLACCNGDLTLAYRYQPSTPESNLDVQERNKKEVLVEGEDVNKQEGVKDNSEERPDDINQEHNFIGTEFYFPTRCDYCQNKVWRKVAFQCGLCAMICHKRCIDNAQTNTYCTSSGVRAKPPVWQMATNTVDQKDDGTPSSPTKTQDFIPPKLPDEYALRPGIRNGRISPNVLRRRSRLTRRLSMDDIVSGDTKINSIPEDVEDFGLNDSIAAAAVTAKEAGRELFASLDEDNRETDIQEKVERLQGEINIENEKQSSTRQMLLVAKDAENIQKLQIILRKSEERGQALALLMIQYCAALNECILLDESQQCDI